MEIKDVDYVLEVFKHQNITRAAKALYISQSALSRYISNLEKRMGIRLFTRLGNKFTPTYEGKIYIERAKEISLSKKMLESELTDIISKDKGQIRVALPVIRGSHILPYVIPDFIKTYPNVNILIKEQAAQSLEELILSGDIDIAIVHLPLKNSYISYEQIRKENLLIVVPNNNPLCNEAKIIRRQKYPWIDVSLFKDEKFILTHSTQRTRQICDEIFKKERFNPNILLCTENIETAIKLSSHNVGVTFAPETFVENLKLNNPPRCFVIGNPIITSDLVVAYRKGNYLSVPTKEFIRLLKYKLRNT